MGLQKNATLKLAGLFFVVSLLVRLASMEEIKVTRLMKFYQ
jgi:hypothetical protein